MLVDRTTSIRKCDFCGTEEFVFKHCLGCGKDVCQNCKHTKGTCYEPFVVGGAGEDAFYCQECDQAKAAQSDELHKAYKAIQTLRSQQRSWQESFKERSQHAQGKLQKLIHKK